jgi:hypothetical protein
MRPHDRVHVLASVDRNGGQHGVARIVEEAADLDRHRSEVLVREPAEPLTIGFRERGKGHPEIGHRRAAAARKQDVHEVAEAAAEPDGDGQRQPPDQGGQRGAD